MRGKNTVLIGAQWGDEGKGKVIDVLTERADWVVRYQGGSNAGHTVEIGGVRYVLHLVPSGIFRPACRCVIGNGVVLDPLELVKELEGVQAAGIPFEDRLFISDRAHLVMPWHRALDAGRKAVWRPAARSGRPSAASDRPTRRKCNVAAYAPTCSPRRISGTCSTCGSAKPTRC